MIKLIYYSIIGSLFLSDLIHADPNLQCGDWDSYKDEKCYRVLDNKEMQSYGDAKNSCHQLEGSGLVTIHTQKEQEFLINLFNNKHKIVNDIWIGAQYKEKLLKWMDNTTTNFTNWSEKNPKNESIHECVQISMDTSYLGKWMNEPCNKKNIVVCQKSQNWLYSYMQLTVQKMKENFDKYIATTNEEIKGLKNELSITKLDFVNQIKDLKKYLENKTYESVPVGTVAYFTNVSVPPGWLKANGQSVSRVKYENLFLTISTTYGSGDGSTTFTLPDLRGEFIRGWSDGRDVDKDRKFGSFQWGSSIPYSTRITNNANVLSTTGWYQNRYFAGEVFDGGFQHDITVNQTLYGMTFNGWTNDIDLFYSDVTKRGKITDWNILQGTRPRNIALLACIKY